ncbi:MAG: CoA-binding protein [Ignavibacteria bacterium]|nr:CoA-binding protein [Ignavibacteria bacterium]
MNISDLLTGSKVIAVVGFSSDYSRPSNRVARYLSGNGYEVYGINPNCSESSVEGIPVFPSLKTVNKKIDIVNVFRKSEYLPETVMEAVGLNPKPLVIWTQIGVIDESAKITALKSEIAYVENKCIMTEHQRLLL